MKRVVTETMLVLLSVVLLYFAAGVVVMFIYRPQIPSCANYKQAPPSSKLRVALPDCQFYTRRATVSEMFIYPQYWVNHLYEWPIVFHYNRIQMSL